MNRRQSNIELLRIVALLCIITFHCTIKSGLSFDVTVISGNMLIYNAFWMLGELGVNLFMLITGYFQIRGRFKAKKLLRLIATALFYEGINLYVLTRLGTFDPSSPRNFLSILFPWYISAYLVVYILSPWLNILARAMTQRQYRNFLFALLTLYCVIPTFLGMFRNTTEFLFYYNRLIWLFIVYFLGAYIYIYRENHQIPVLKSRNNALAATLLAAAVILASILFVSRHYELSARIGVTSPYYFWTPNSVPMLLLSLGVFGLFLHLDVPYSRAVNTVASATLGIYLLHDGPMSPWIWTVLFRCAEYNNSPFLVFHILRTVVSVFLAGFVIDLVRQALERFFLDPVLDSAALASLGQTLRGCGSRLLGRLSDMDVNFSKTKETPEMNMDPTKKLADKLTERQARTLKYGAWALLAASFAVLACYRVVYYTPLYTVPTTVAALALGLLFIKKTCRELLDYIREYPLQAVFLLLASALIIWAMQDSKGPELIDQVFYPLPLVPVRLFRLRYCVLAIPALFYLSLWLWKKGRAFLSELWSSMTPAERRLYLAASVVFSLAALAAVNVRVTPGSAEYHGWYWQADHLYSLDCRVCFRSIWPLAGYYNLRHPTLGIVTFPIWVFARAAARLFVPPQFLDPLTVFGLQLVNIQAMLLTGVMTGKLSKSRWVFPLYLASFPTLLFSVVLEKYHLLIFLLVLYVYQRSRGKSRTNLTLLFAAGCMPTSIFLYADELLEREPPKEKLRRCLVMLRDGVLFLLCTGCTHLLNIPFLLYGISGHVEAYGAQGLTFRQSLCSFLSLVHNTLLPLASAVSWDPTGQKPQYLWTGVLTEITPAAVLIFLLMAIGFLANRKDPFTRTCCVWVAVAAVLFGVIQWAAHESPLFSLYFSWAMIPLFQKGVQVLTDRLKLRESLVYALLLTCMLSLNFTALIDINRFISSLWAG